MNKKFTAFLFTLIFSVITVPAFAQDVLLEYHPKQGYVLVTSKGVVSKNIPTPLVTQLKKLRGNIKDIAFTPDGKGWVIVTKNRHIAHDVDGNFLAKLKQVQASGKKVQSVAFNTQDWANKKGFVIIHDKGYVAEGISKPLTDMLNQFENKTRGIQTIEFTPDGGWTVVSGVYEWSRMIQGPQVQNNFIDSIRRAYLQGHNVLDVSFNPQDYSKQYGWIFITDKGYNGMNIPDSLQKSLASAGINKI